MAASNVEKMSGQPVNAAPFAAVQWWQGAGHEMVVYRIERDAEGCLHPHVDTETGQWHIGVEWEMPRDVKQVLVRFADADLVPDRLQVQYWRHNWPTPAPERLAGARRGWIGRDDPFHGHWVTVKAGVPVLYSPRPVCPG